MATQLDRLLQGMTEIQNRRPEELTITYSDGATVIYTNDALTLLWQELMTCAYLNMLIKNGNKPQPEPPAFLVEEHNPDNES